MDLIAVCCEMCYVTSEELEYMKWELIEVGANKRVSMPEATTRPQYALKPEFGIVPDYPFGRAVRAGIERVG